MFFVFFSQERIVFLNSSTFLPCSVYLQCIHPFFKVLYVQAFVCVILLAKLIRKVFFGQLRAAETEVNKQKHYRISVKSVHVVLVLLTVGAWTPNMPFFNKTNSILLSSERAKKNYPHFILLFTCVCVCE